MTLRARVAILVAVAVGIAVAAVAIAAQGSARSEAIAEIDRFLRTRAPLAGLIDGGGSGLGPGGGGRGPGPQSVIADDVVAQVLFADSGVATLGEAAVILPVAPVDLAVAAGKVPETVRTVTVGDVEYRMLTRRAGPAVAIQVARDLTETEAVLAGLRNRMAAIGIAVAALAAAAGWLLAGRAVRPVGELTAAAERVAATGALEGGIPVQGDDEIARLATAFNEMLARLHESREAQHRLVADASHELRTPLTSLRTNIELLAAGAVPTEERAAVLADLESEIGALSVVVGELVDLATVGREAEPAVLGDLAEVITAETDRARRRGSHPIAVTVTPHPATFRPAAVARAVSNLIDNAIKWSPPGSEIAVSVVAGRVAVADRGPGIDPADLPFVFDRFYRAPAARGLPGSGLGLAIVSAVCLDHGWAPFARNRDGGGAEVGFALTAGTAPAAAES